MNSSELYDMSDEDLEKAFKEAKASLDSPESDIETNNDEQETQEDYVQEEENTEEIEDGSEHSEDTDSDHDTSTEDEVEESEEDDSEEDAKEDLDEDPQVDSEEGSPKEKTATPNVQQGQQFKFKANGREYEFSQKEIIDQFPKIFGQAMDYTKKMQAIKPWRKTIDAMEQAKLSHEDVSLMIDVLKGDKEAVAEVLKRTGTDALELDLENAKYQPKDYGRDETTLAIKDILEDISKDPEYNITHSILSSKWDERSWNDLVSTPEDIKALHIDVKSGMFDIIQPIADKLKVYDGARGSDLDYYKLAANQYFQQQERQKQEAFIQQRNTTQLQEQKAKQQAEQAKIAEVKAKNSVRTETKQAAVKRKAATPPKTVARPRNDVVDYLDDSDEAFEEWYKKLQENN